jgi:MFS family permease
MNQSRGRYCGEVLSSLGVLRIRNYALLWWSGLISDAGTWMQAVAIGALVTDITKSAGWGALVAGASFLALGLITPFGGVVADHRDRRLLMLSTSIALAVVAALLAVLYAVGEVSPVVLLVVVVVEGTLMGFTLPARSAMMPDIVGADRLADASALGNASWNLGRCIGPALAGVVIAWGSYTLIFAINAVTCAVAAVALLFVRVPHHPRTSSGTLVQRLREGVRGARADEGCWSAIRFIAITAVLVSPFIALMPAMAQLVFDGTAVDTAHFTMAQGLGSVVGAFLLASTVRRFGRLHVMITLLFALPLFEMIFAAAPTKWAAIIGAFLLGAGYVAITVGMTVIVQLRSLREVRGRVISLCFMTLSFGYSVGAAIQGRLADEFGIREVLFVAPIVYLCVLGIIAVRSPQWFLSLGDAPAVTTGAAVLPGGPATATVEP